MKHRLYVRRRFRLHGSPSECGTVLSVDHDMMVFHTYKTTEANNPHSHHNENLKFDIFSREDDSNVFPKL